MAQLARRGIVIEDEELEETDVKDSTKIAPKKNEELTDRLKKLEEFRKNKQLKKEEKCKDTLGKHERSL